jgi:hypothetical protein
MTSAMLCCSLMHNFQEELLFFEGVTCMQGHRTVTLVSVVIPTDVTGEALHAQRIALETQQLSVVEFGQTR